MASVTYYNQRRQAYSVDKSSRGRVRFVSTNFGAGGAVAVQTVKFRRELSFMGTRTGSRQAIY